MGLSFFKDVPVIAWCILGVIACFTVYVWRKKDFNIGGIFSAKTPPKDKDTFKENSGDINAKIINGSVYHGTSNICNVNMAIDSLVEKKKIELSKNEEEILVTWVNSTDKEFYRQDFNNKTVFYLGFENGGYYEVYEKEELAKWNAFFEKLISFGFIEFEKSNEFGKPIYALKKNAYDYVNKISL